jgi:hypothetical protein
MRPHREMEPTRTPPERTRCSRSLMDPAFGPTRRRDPRAAEWPTARVISRDTRPHDPGPIRDAAASANGTDPHAARANTVVPKPHESSVRPQRGNGILAPPSGPLPGSSAATADPVTRGQFAMRPHREMEPTRTPPERTRCSRSLMDPAFGPTRRRDPRAAEWPTALVISRDTRPHDPGPIRDAAASANGTDPHAARANTVVPKPHESSVRPQRGNGILAPPSGPLRWSSAATPDPVTRDHFVMRPHQQMEPTRTPRERTRWS